MPATDVKLADCFILLLTEIRSRVAGMSAKELSSKTGLALQTVYHFRAGRRASQTTIYALCKYLDSLAKPSPPEPDPEPVTDPPEPSETETSHVP